MAEPPAPPTHVDMGNPVWRAIWRVNFALARLSGNQLRALAARGVPSFRGRIVELELAGRLTGRPRPVQVTLIQLDGRWYVGHPTEDTAWLRNLAASDRVKVTVVGGASAWVHAMPLGLGLERTAVIKATASQQLITVRPFYRASRGSILRAGVYHRALT